MKKTNDPSKAGKSKYATKQRLKHGAGVRSPNWMTWFENPLKPRTVGLPG